VNRLRHETSPYLLQHAENPVHWYAWGEEALQAARTQDKPILLSIGYSACHWCHVMAHESFEDEATAAVMNQHFINIKVDREERPDLDDIYMRATQIFQRGHGGWPMTVFLTPEGKPFHAGTYYPKEPRYGMPSFIQVMQAVVDAYQNRREEVERGAAQVTELLHSDPLSLAVPQDEALFTPALLRKAAQGLIARADMEHGGLHTGQPKFPSPMNPDYLLRYVAATGDETVLKVVTFTLKKMAQGGIYDQLGYGFHRYSVDNRWLVPHFEKMLYDNAQLARVYLHAYQITGDSFFKTICTQILTYVEREMRDPNGGFYSAQDADSEGEEGKFFVWSLAELETALVPYLSAERLKAVLAYWGVSAGGNFEGHNILHVAEGEADPSPELLADLEMARGLLFDLREKRVKPLRDDKMLAAWNGFMLAAFAEAGRVLGKEHYLKIAEENAAFLLGALSAADGRLYRTYRGGESKLNAYLEDYAAVIEGLLELYQSTFEPRWFHEARRLCEYVLAHFVGGDDGGFYDTSDDHENLITRPRSLQDNATPSGNSHMAYNLLRMSAYTGDLRYEQAALTSLRQVVVAVTQYPSAFGMALTAIHFLVHGAQEVALIGPLDAPSMSGMLAVLRASFRPNVIVAHHPQDADGETRPELLAYRTQKDGLPTAYVCRKFTCQMPVTDAEALEKMLVDTN
jgi:uncharacterized protein YyaL (SSP411 family)